MSSYLPRRLLQVPPMLAILVTALFFGLHVGPRPPSPMIGVDANEERRLSIGGDITFRTELAGDYRAWVPRVIRGDLGHSAFYDRPVTEVLRERVGPSLLIITISFAATLLIGIPLGILSVRKRGTSFDLMTNAMTALGSAIPIFVLALAFSYLLATRGHWVPNRGYEPARTNSLEWARFMILPCGTLAISAVAQLAAFTRSALLGAIAANPARTARSKGMPERTVLLRHALRSVSAPIVSSLGRITVNLIGGLVVVEQVFDIPGLGKLVLQSFSRRDFAVLQGTVLIAGLTIAVIHVVFDLLAAVIDPRLRTV